jgi:peptide/nickel transport system substrate-binding protein
MAESNYWTRRRAVSRRRFLIGVGAAGAGAASLTLVGCGGDRNGSTSSTNESEKPGGPPKQGGRLVVVQTTQPGFLDPHASTGGQDITFLRALYDNLVKRGDDMVPKADWSIAESWEVKEEGKQILFRIRSGVKFHDGTALDAEAVKWNMDHFLDPSNDSPEKANVSQIQKAEVVDARTVRLTLSRPSASVLNLLGDRAGMLLSPTAFQTRGKDAFRRNPVGTGPFKFKEWVQDDHITLVRNEEYWRKPLPYLDEIRWNFIKEPAVHLANLEAGSADIAGVAPADLKRVEGNANLKIMRFTGGSISNFYVNNAFAPWDNKYNRLAFAWAIDREAIVKGLLLGQGQPAVGPISPAFQWAFVADVPNAPKKDIAKAKDFLSKAGNPRGYDIHLPGGNSASEIQVAEAIQGQLAEVGIKLSYEPLDVTTYVNKAIVEKSVPGYMSGIVLRGDPNAISQVFHSDGFYNPAHLKDEVARQIDSLLDQADATFDLGKRKQLYLELTKVINDDGRGIFRWYTVANNAMNKRVQGWSFGSEGNGRWEETWLSS